MSNFIYKTLTNGGDKFQIGNARQLFNADGELVNGYEFTINGSGELGFIETEIIFDMMAYGWYFSERL